MKYTREPYLRTSSPRHLRIGGFTLVEMIAVMGIIVVLSTLALGGMRGINSSGNRRSAISKLMGVLDQARMLAISENRATYVVFASPLPGQAAAPAQITPAMWGQAYAIFQDTSDFKPIQRSAWIYLPAGVAFKSNNSDGQSALTNQPRDASDTTAFPIASISSQTSEGKSLPLPYLKFDPMGSLVDYKGNIVEADSPASRLLLFEGSVASSGAETSTRHLSSSDADSRKRFLDEVDVKPTTGRAKYVLDPLDNLASAATPAP